MRKKRIPRNKPKTKVMNIMRVAFLNGKATFLKQGIFIMNYVLLCAVGVGGATVLGAVLGFIFKGCAEKFGNTILAFAVGVMLAASVFTLIIPSVEYSIELCGNIGVLVTIFGIFAGAIALSVIDKLIPVSENPVENTDVNTRRGVVLFIIAIAIHNLPEGLAAGVSFGSGNLTDTLLIAGSIALQNIPEGTVIIAPMLSVGITPRRTFLIALLTGVVEVIGTFIGYFAISITHAALPFALAFAGGTMLDVIADDMIPKTHGKSGGGAIYAMLSGFGLMVVLDALL